MELMTWIQFLDAAVHVSLGAYIFKKDTNPSFYNPNSEKIVGQLGSLTLVRQPILENEKSEFKPVLQIVVVSYLAVVVAVGKYFGVWVGFYGKSAHVGYLIKSCLYIYIYIYKLAVRRFHFWYLLHRDAREGRYSFPWVAPVYPWFISYNAEC